MAGIRSQQQGDGLVRDFYITGRGRHKSSVLHTSLPSLRPMRSLSPSSCTRGVTVSPPDDHALAPGLHGSRDRRADGPRPAHRSPLERALQPAGGATSLACRPRAARHTHWSRPGAPPAAATIERLEVELGWEVTQVYGLTETGPFLTVCEPRPEHPDWRQRSVPSSGPARALSWSHPESYVWSISLASRCAVRRMRVFVSRAAAGIVPPLRSSPAVLFSLADAVIRLVLEALIVPRSGERRAPR